MRNVVIIPVMFSLVATFLIGFIFIVSDRFGTEILIGTLPVQRKDIVFSRYLISISFELLFLFLAEILILLVVALKHIQYDMPYIYESIIVGFGLFIIINSLQMPLYFMFSSIKSKQMLIIVPFVVLACLIFFYQSVVYGNSEWNCKLVLWMIRNTGITDIMILLISLLTLLTSYYVSLRVFQKKEL